MFANLAQLLVIEPIIIIMTFFSHNTKMNQQPHSCDPLLLISWSKGLRLDEPGVILIFL